MSGFSPINYEIKNWKTTLAKKYGVHKLDLFLLGLLWLRFRGAEIDELVESDISLPDLLERVEEIRNEMGEEANSETAA